MLTEKRFDNIELIVYISLLIPFFYFAIRWGIEVLATPVGAGYVTPEFKFWLFAFLINLVIIAIISLTFEIVGNKLFPSEQKLTKVYVNKKKAHTSLAFFYGGLLLAMIGGFFFLFLLVLIPSEEYTNYINLNTLLGQFLISFPWIIASFFFLGVAMFALGSLRTQEIEKNEDQNEQLK